MHDYKVTHGTGHSSWVGSSSCTITLFDIGGGNTFRLQEKRDLYFLTYLAAYAVTAPGDPTSPYQQFTYDTTTLQIRNPASGWCLDDHGGEAQGLDNRNEIVSFAPCDPTSINQQFIYSNLRIFNPNWPNSNLVLNRAGSTVTVSGTTLNQIMLWNNDAVNPDEDFVIFLVCNPGMRHMRITLFAFYCKFRVLYYLSHSIRVYSLPLGNIFVGHGHNRFLN